MEWPYVVLIGIVCGTFGFGIAAVLAASGRTSLEEEFNDRLAQATRQAVHWQNLAEGYRESLYAAERRHAKILLRIRKQGKKRGAVTGANA